MPMPMQISLDEVLSMLLSRVDAMTMANENMKSKFNILARALYKKLGYKEIDIVPTVFNGIPGVNLVLLEKHLG